MRTAHRAVAVLAALAATAGCDSDRLVTPEAPVVSRGEGVDFDALAGATCRNVRGMGTAVLDPSTGELVGVVSGGLTGTHRGSGVAMVHHGNGATSQTAYATYETSEVGTFILAEELVLAPVSPTRYKVTFRGTVVPGNDVTAGFLTAQGYMDVSGLPQGEFDYHGRICT